MIEDFPVLGPPISPTEICFLSACREENCRSSWMSEPFPKEFVMEAWKARVGYSLERLRTHPAYVELAFELVIYVKTSIQKYDMSVSSLRSMQSMPRNWLMA
jgi:hypothetical protein